MIDWPQHLAQKYRNPETQAAAALGEYFAWSKGNWGIADFLAQCSEAEIPEWLRDAAMKLKDACVPTPAGGGEAGAPADAGALPVVAADGTD